jgi:hypothetical protein
MLVHKKAKKAHARVIRFCEKMAEISTTTKKGDGSHLRFELLISAASNKQAYEVKKRGDQQVLISAKV